MTHKLGVSYSPLNGITHQSITQTHLQELSICAVYSSFHTVGEQTHHTAVHCPVFWSSTKVLNASPHALHKEWGVRKPAFTHMSMWPRLSQSQCVCKLLFYTEEVGKGTVLWYMTLTPKKVVTLNTVSVCKVCLRNWFYKVVLNPHSNILSTIMFHKVKPVYLWNVPSRGFWSIPNS